MKEVLNLVAEKRSDVGTHASRRQRREGRVPCVLYGHKQETQSIAVDYVALESIVRHHTRMLDLTLDGKAERALLASVQYDAFGMDIVHADFIRVAMDELIRVRVPVTLKGKAKGEAQGAVTEQLLTEVEVECLPANIPDAIVHVITELDVSESVKVSELKVPAGVKIITEPTHLVVTVAALKIAEPVAAAPGAEVAAEAGAAGPEIIARGKEEEEGEEGEAGEKKAKEKK